MGRLIGSQHAASVRLQYLNGCFGRDGCRVERPTKMLASVAATDRLTVMVQHFLIEGVDQLELFTYGWRRFKSATCEITRNLSRKPRTSLRGAADHDCIGTRRCQREQRIFEGTNIAIDYHRNRNGILHRADGDPVRVSVVELTARTTMNRYELDAGRLGATRKFRRVDGGRIPTQSHLQGDRNLHGRHRRIDQAQRVIEIAHECRTGSPVDDLLRGTTHIDVDDVGALGFGDTGAFGDPMCFTASKLHYMDSDTLPLATNNSFAFATNQASTSGHFRNHQPRA